MTGAQHQPGEGGEAGRVAFERVRWHCRRGLLELDLVLSRFLDSHWPELAAPDRDAFAALLGLPDNDLWDIVSGRGEHYPAGAVAVVGLLRAV